MRILVFLTIVIVAYVVYIWARNRRRPDNFKDMCICKHSRAAHKSYIYNKEFSLVAAVARCEVNECPCPEFIQAKKHNTSHPYFWRDEGPAARISREMGKIVAMILIAFVPRDKLLDWAYRLQKWVKKEEKELEKEEAEKDDPS